MEKSKLSALTIFAIIILAALPISACAPEQKLLSAAQHQAKSETTTYTETEIIWSYSNETTITNNTPQSEVCEPEQTVSAEERSFVFPGILADKNITLYFIFKLNSTIMKSIKDFESAAAVGTPIYLGSFTLTLWFLGYKFNSTDYEEAEPYSSPLITFNTEDKIAAGELQYDMIYNGTEPILCCKYYGTLGKLFKLSSQEQELISAAKLFILSCTHRKPFTKETTEFTLPNLTEMLLLDWQLNQQIVTYDYYYLATPVRNIKDNTGDKSKHNWYAFNECRIPLSATTTISWSANNKEQQTAGLSVAKDSSRVEKETNPLISAWARFYHAPAPFYFKIFQIYAPLDMKWIKVYTTIKAEAPASFPEDVWGMTDEGPLQESTKCAIEKSHWEYIPRDSSQMPYIRHRNYTMTSPSPGWYYFAVFTPCPNLELKMNISFNCSQPLEKASYVQEALDMLSRDPAGARWYSQCEFENTSFSKNTTVNQSKYTTWSNKTYDFYYFNSGSGTDNITYNGTDYTNGTWVPAEPSDINTAWLAVNPSNSDGSNASAWFLKYSYTIYNRTITTAEKTIKKRIFVYEYKHRALFDYTQKLNHPSELVEGVKTGRIQTGATKHSLMIPGFSLTQSFAQLEEYNLNASQLLAWMPPTFAHNASQGKYIKNAWVELIMFPTVRGTYFWTRAQADFKILYYYETMPPWALNANYTITSTSSCTQYFNPGPGTSSTYSFTGKDTGRVSFSQPCSFSPQSIFTVSAEIYKNGALYDTENVTTFWNCSYEIMPPQTNKSMLTLYLKEDMETMTNTYYKVYSITNSSYQEKGYKDIPPGEPPSYPYFGFSIDTESETGLPVSANVMEHIQSAGAATNLTELANYYSNLTANVTNAALVSASNTSYSFYMLSLERTYFAYPLYEYVLYYKPDSLETLYSGLDRAAEVNLTETIQDRTVQMNETTNATAPPLEETKENITQAGVSMPPIDASLLAEVESAPKNITASKQLIIVPVLWHTKPTEKLWVYTYYDCAVITDKTEVDFTASNSWSMSQINTMLDTGTQLTIVRPMKSVLEIEFDKPHYEAGENGTLKIQLYIGSAAQATIDGELAAANKNVTVTIPTKDEGMITTNVTTNGTGAGEIKFTMPSGGGHVKITAHFDCDELHIGSAKVQSYFYVMPPLLALLYALLPIALVCLVVYVFFRYVVLRSWRRAFFGQERGD